MSKYSQSLLSNKAIALITLFFLNGCINNNNLAIEGQVFRYNEHKNITSLDPAFAKDNANIWAVNQLFNGLVEMDDNMKIIPSIAKKWDISENGTLYTFYLRKDVYFHSHEKFGTNTTRSVNAADFEFSFKRLMDPKVASPGGWVLKNVKEFSVIGSYKFKIKLKKPFASFLELLTMKYCSVVPKEIVDYYGVDFRNNPVGTGPFFFKNWSENNKLVFRKNKKYFETDEEGKRLPYLEAVAITFLPEKQSEYSQFIQGNIDFISGLDATYKDHILNPYGLLQKKHLKNINMIRGPYLNTEYLGFFMDSDVDEVKSNLLRQAFNYGFDRKKMIKYLRNNIGNVGEGGFIPKGLPGFNSNIGFKYNPKKAKGLVDEYKKLNKKNSTPSLNVETTKNYLSFCEFIQRSLLDIGIKMTINVMPGSALKSAKANGKTNIFRASWVADYPDAQNYLSLFYSKNFAPNGPNYTHFKNDNFDVLYESAMVETNDSLRVNLYKKMDEIVMRETPVVVLFYDEVLRFTQKNIKGLGINPTNLLDLRRVKKN
ncbi:MAG: ABC transporter substrate-binding protein [Flavobacteriaceae bacterium]|nr:ABC transporter substrate-binding protein [Flavobacteriaceae bacterium]|tara:strand:- start:14177 stop:15799 length:1623 start_codon:yes stop_codon:yes gene_type:complete